MDEEGFSEKEIKKLVNRFKDMIDSGETRFIDSDELEVIADDLIAHFDFQYAKEAVSLGISMYPKNVDFRLMDVKLMIMEFDYDEAGEELDRIEQEFPPTAEFYVEKAFLCKMSNADEDAFPLLKKAYDLESEDPEINFMLGGEYVRLKDYIRGFEHVSYALMADEDIGEQLFTLSYVFEDSKEYDAAVEFFGELVDKLPLCKAAWFALGLAYSWRKEFDPAIDAYLNAISLDPEASTAYFNIGNAYYEKEDYAHAIHYYKEAYRIDDQDHHALSGIGDCLYEVGRVDEALSYYQKALQVFPDSSDAIMGAITILKETGRDKEAEAFILKAFSVNPQTFEMLFNVLPFFKENEKIAKLKELFHVTLNQLSFKDDFLKIFTMYCASQPQLCELGIEVLEEYLDNEEVAQTIPYLLAALHFRTGNHVVATNYLKTALIINYPDHEMFLAIHPDLPNNPSIQHLIEIHKPRL